MLNPIAQEKKFLRQKILQQRDQALPQEQQLLSQKICKILSSHSLFKTKGLIAAYYPLKSEVNILPTLQQWQKLEKQIILPRVPADSNELNWHITDLQNSKNFEKTSWGGLQPQAFTPEVSLSQVEVFIIPGVSFDRQGYRLGYGRGYYDRLLAELPQNIPTVGVCFESQMRQSLPKMEHDQKVQFLVTENGFVSC